MTMQIASSTLPRKFASGEDLRQQADICRGLAGIARTERNRLFWLRLANEWAELALSADRQEPQPRAAL
jgi:gluconate kinase